jgi:hypothetical protein
MEQLGQIQWRGVFQKEIRLALDVALTIPHNQIYIMPVKLDDDLGHRMD